MNPFDLMKNANAIKEQLDNVRDQLEDLTATGSSGGRMVVVTINARFEMIDIKLDPICVDNRDVKMLEDLIIAAQHDAIANIREVVKQKGAPFLKDLNIPGL